MSFLRTMAWMVRKELLRFAADPFGAVATLFVPVVLAVLMSVLFAPTGVVEPMALQVAVEQDGPRVRHFLASLQADPTLLVEVVTREQAQAHVLDGTAAAALVLPAGTDDVLQPLSMFAGTSVPVQVLYDPSRATEVDILAGLITRTAMTQMSGELATNDGRTRMFRQLGLITTVSPLFSLDQQARWSRFANAGIELDAADVDGASGGMPLELQRVPLDVFNPKTKWNPHAHYFAGMLTMFMLFLAATSALNLVAERDEGALMRVMLSGASPLAVLLGGALGTSLVAFTSCVLVYLTGIGVFGIQVGNPVGLLAMLLSVSALVGGFSLLLSGVGQTARQISVIAPFAILVMGFIGGSAMPTFIMPEWVQTLGLFLPTTWANEGLAASTWRGASTIACLHWAAGVFGFATLFSAIGCFLFRWR